MDINLAINSLCYKTAKPDNKERRKGDRMEKEPLENDKRTEKRKILEELRKAKVKKQRIIGIIVAGIIVTSIVTGMWYWERGEESEDFTFAYQDRVADAASIIAVEKGFFKDEGLNIKTMRFSSGPACTEALIYGNAEFFMIIASTIFSTLLKIYFTLSFN